MSDSRRQCTATAASGERCQNWAYGDGDKCHVHTVGVSATAGRKTVLTPQRADLLIAALRSGNYVHVACRAAGIGRETFREWMLRGESGEEKDAPFAELRERVEQARAEGQVRNVAIIYRAAETDWRAATWLLERQWPELWGGVSVRVRTEAEPPPEELEASADDADPFVEFDQLAERRQRRMADG